jgi:hypothetical protein
VRFVIPVELFAKNEGMRQVFVDTGFSGKLAERLKVCDSFSCLAVRVQLTLNSAKIRKMK